MRVESNHLRDRVRHFPHFRDRAGDADEKFVASDGLRDGHDFPIPADEGSSVVLLGRIPRADGNGARR